MRNKFKIKKYLSREALGKRGMTLFIAVVIMGILLFISFAVVNIAIKSTLFASSGRDSQYAFYAADAGLECALYWDSKFDPSMFDPGSNTIYCANQSFTVGGGTSVNVAQGKNASQVSTYDGTTGASKAVDGNTGGNYFSGEISHTGYSLNSAWWSVDLGSSVAVSSVVIWNRTDCAFCINRLSNYWIFISDTPFGSSDTATYLSTRPNTWAYHQTSAPNLSSTISTSGAQGRYVRVQLSEGTGDGYLHMGEVQVFSIVSGSGTSDFSFNMNNGLNPMPYCVSVSVTKNAGSTHIESRGYNTCDTSNQRRVERGIEITY